MILCRDVFLQYVNIGCTLYLEAEIMIIMMRKYGRTILVLKENAKTSYYTRSKATEMDHISFKKIVAEINTKISCFKEVHQKKL